MVSGTTREKMTCETHTSFYTGMSFDNLFYVVIVGVGTKTYVIIIKINGHPKKIGSVLGGEMLRAW
jgi:hypothetical protein